MQRERRRCPGATRRYFAPEIISQILASRFVVGWDCNRTAIATIVNSAMMVEALTNFIASEALSKFHRTAIDSLPLPEKIVLLSQLVYEDPIKENSHVIEHVKYLTKQRNRLVHFKPRKFKYADWMKQDESTFHYSLRQAAKALSTCCLVASKMERLDPSILNRYRGAVQETVFAGIEIEEILHEEAASFLRHYSAEELHRVVGQERGERPVFAKKWFWCQPASELSDDLKT